MLFLNSDYKWHAEKKCSLDWNLLLLKRNFLFHHICFLSSRMEAGSVPSTFQSKEASVGVCTAFRGCLNVALAAIDSIPILLAFGAVPLQVLWKVQQSSFWPGLRTQIRKVHYFISSVYYFLLWFCFVFFSSCDTNLVLITRAKSWKVTGFWLTYFPGLFPIWNWLSS